MFSWLNLQFKNIASLMNDKTPRKRQCDLPTCIANQKNQSNSLYKSKIKMAHLNIRSLKNRDHCIQMRKLVEDGNYDIAISESWLNSTVTNVEVELMAYKLSRLGRLKKTGGGVCVYTRNSL